MTNKKQVAYAPYNFIPFPEKIINRYQDLNELPSHDLSKEGDKHLLSGEITFDIVAESPILVAKGKDRNEKKSPNEFVKNAEGKYVIPGSTLRGLIRNNVRVLSMSDWSRDIQEEKFYYRAVGESSTSLGKEYRRVLGITNDGQFGSVPRKVKAGYIVKYGRNYVIYPARTDGGRKGKSYYKYHINKVPKKDKVKYRKYLEYGFEVQECKFSVNQYGKAIKLNNEDASFKGHMIFTGSIRNKRTFYIINEINKAAKPIQLTEDDIKAFKADYNYRKSKFFKKKRENLEKHFSLPRKNGIEAAKPCFYLHHNDKVYFGFTAFLRIPYNQTTKDLIPSRIKEKAFGIDYEQALFGFVNNKVKDKEPDGNYASRIKVFPSELSEHPRNLVKSDVTLMGPRASSVQMYLEQELDKKDYYTYNDKHAQLRGMKQYWIKDTFIGSKGSQSLHLLPDSSLFSAKIRFEQLHKDELGLLLWALKGPTFHQLGMGKPYGYGVVKFTNFKCRAIRPMDKYDNLGNFFQIDMENIDIDSYIELYKHFIEEHFSINLEEAESLRLFFAMKEKSPLSQEKMKYMPLENGYDKKPKLPTVQDLLDGKY